MVIVLPIYVRVYDEKKSKDPYENQPGFWWNLAFSGFRGDFHRPQAIWANDSINRSKKTGFKIGQTHISRSKFKHNNYRYMIHAWNKMFFSFSHCELGRFFQPDLRIPSVVLWMKINLLPRLQEGGARLTLVSGKTLGQCLWRTENIGRVAVGVRLTVFW